MLPPCGRAVQKGVGLRAFDYWERGFEYRWQHGCSSVPHISDAVYRISHSVKVKGMFGFDFTLLPLCKRVLRSSGVLFSRNVGS